MTSASRSRCISLWSWRTSWGLDMISFQSTCPKLNNGLVGFKLCWEEWQVNSHIHTFLNPYVSHTNLFTVVRGELTVPEEALKVPRCKHTLIVSNCHLCTYVGGIQVSSWSFTSTRSSPAASSLVTSCPVTRPTRIPPPSRQQRHRQRHYGPPVEAPRSQREAEWAMEWLPPKSCRLKRQKRTRRRSVWEVRVWTKLCAIVQNPKTAIKKKCKIL